MKIKNIPETVSAECRVVSSANAHTFAEVTSVIDEKKADEFLSLAENRQSVEIESDSGNLILKGFVKDVSVKSSVSETTAEIVIVSDSWKLQEQGKDRIFQNPEKTTADILKSFPDVETGMCDKINEPVEDIIYQYKTDDFTFIKMLASRCGCGVFVTEDGKLQFGKTNSSDSIKSNSDNYKNSVFEKTVSVCKDNREISFVTEKQFLNGSEISADGVRYTVYRTEIYDEFDETHYRYNACTNPVYDECVSSPEFLVAVAKVTDNNDSEHLGRVQVKFTEFEDNDSQKMWIPVITGFTGKDNGGLIMIPDIDDTVIVFISSEKAYVMGSMREEKLPDKCYDPIKKYIYIGKNLLVAEDEKISFSQGDNTGIIITDDSITAKTGDSCLTLNKENISAQLEKSLLSIKKDSISAQLEKSLVSVKKDSVSATQDSTKLCLESKKADIKSGQSELVLDGGKTKLNGSSIDLNTQAMSG